MNCKHVKLRMKTYSTRYPSLYTFDVWLIYVVYNLFCVESHVAYIHMLMLMDLKCIALTL